uniref:Coatomer subunit gamma-2 n=1 Tax=Lygus hesperus TaxID=30085 RepID=A0A0A9XUK9_LYGHE
MMHLAAVQPMLIDPTLNHLVEFIDDCELTRLMKKVLSYVADEAPHTSDPRRYLRYIYNHVTLEEAELRAVAVTTLAKIACRVPPLRKSIRVLLRRCSNDSDDEVRDRALFYSALLARRDKHLLTEMIENVTEEVKKERAQVALSSLSHLSTSAASGGGGDGSSNKSKYVEDSKAA